MSHPPSISPDPRVDAKRLDETAAKRMDDCVRDELSKQFENAKSHAHPMHRMTKAMGLLGLLQAKEVAGTRTPLRKLDEPAYLELKLRRGSLERLVSRESQHPSVKRVLTEARVRGLRRAVPNLERAAQAHANYVGGEDFCRRALANGDEATIKRELSKLMRIDVDLATWAAMRIVGYRLRLRRRQIIAAAKASEVADAVRRAFNLVEATAPKARGDAPLPEVQLRTYLDRAALTRDLGAGAMDLHKLQQRSAMVNRLHQILPNDTRGVVAQELLGDGRIAEDVSKKLAAADPELAKRFELLRHDTGAGTRAFAAFTGIIAICTIFKTLPPTTDGGLDAQKVLSLGAALCGVLDSGLTMARVAGRTTTVAGAAARSTKTASTLVATAGKALLENLGPVADALLLPIAVWDLQRADRHQDHVGRWCQATQVACSMIGLAGVVAAWIGGFTVFGPLMVFVAVVGLLATAADALWGKSELHGEITAELEQLGILEAERDAHLAFSGTSVANTRKLLVNQSVAAKANFITHHLETGAVGDQQRMLYLVMHESQRDPTKFRALVEEIDTEQLLANLSCDRQAGDLTIRVAAAYENQEPGRNGHFAKMPALDEMLLQLGRNGRTQALDLFIGRCTRAVFQRVQPEVLRQLTSTLAQRAAANSGAGVTLGRILDACSDEQYKRLYTQDRENFAKPLARAVGPAKWVPQANRLTRLGFGTKYAYNTLLPASWWSLW